MRMLITRVLGNGNLTGGAEHSAYLHTKVLTKLGYTASLYTNAKFDGQKSHFVPRLKILRWIWLWLALPVKALFGRYDVLNPHSREDQIVLSLTRWLHRIPVVWKDPGDLVHNIKLGREGLLGRMNQWLLIKAIEHADAIYTLNDEDRSIILNRLEKLGANFDGSKFSVVPSDILFSDYNLKAKPAEANDNMVIGTVIRLDEHKGVQYLVEAAKLLNQRHDNLEFWVIGDGPFRQRLESMAKNMSNFKFWGYQSDISPYLNGIDIFVQPAEIEAWGRNVKEAMYFSKPVVGSNVGGIAKQITDGQTGLLFEPKNVNQLEKQLDKLIKDNKLRKKLGQAAHKQAVKNGDYVDLVKNQILPLFKKALK